MKPWNFGIHGFRVEDRTQEFEHFLRKLRHPKPAMDSTKLALKVALWLHITQLWQELATLYMSMFDADPDRWLFFFCPAFQPFIRNDSHGWMHRMRFSKSLNSETCGVWPLEMPCQGQASSKRRIWGLFGDLNDSCLKKLRILYWPCSNSWWVSDALVQNGYP